MVKIRVLETSARLCLLKKEELRRCGESIQQARIEGSADPT
jgi:hypothetical protein